MKNLAFIIIAVLGTSAATFAQDGTKQTQPSTVKIDKTAQPLKTNGGSKNKRPVAPKKEEAPAKKVN